MKTNLNSLLLLILQYYIYTQGIQRTLHSFPTRRSSDLPNISSYHLISVNRVEKKVNRVEKKVEEPFTQINMSKRLFYFLDRKSTRLNSSHVKISYAVFCLKKKKNNVDIHDIYNDYEAEM